MKLAHALLDALKAYGAREIFGIPGDFALPFFREIERTATLPLYTLSHEPAVGFAADAAARYRSAISVAAVTCGAGGFNMMNPIAEAYAEKSPVVVISGAPGKAEGAMGLGLHHQAKSLSSQARVYGEVTCAQAILDNAATAPAEIARVLTAARELSRPVYIEFPRDMVEAEVEPVPPYAPTPTDPDAARAAAREILMRLGEARSPALLLCVEVRRYGLEAEVAELARRLQIPTATTFMARGILAGTDAPLIGTYLGLAGEASIREAIEGADLVLMLGVILCDTNFGVSEKLIDRRRMIHAFDRRVSLGYHTYEEVPLADLVAALNAELSGSLVRAAASAAKAAPPPPREPLRGLVADEQPIVPADIARGINDLFAARNERLPIAADMGDCLFTAMDVAYTELVAPAYYATMGTGVPMGFGLEVASGRRPLVLVGDGAFQMTGFELGNARRLGLKPIVLVFNNLSWGMLKVFQPDTRYNDLDDWRFAELATTLGGKGRRVATRRELKEALAAAAADTASWQLIEIMIPRDTFSPTLERFVNAVKRRSVMGKS